MSHFLLLFTLPFFLLAIISPALCHAQAASPSPRFFLMGSGQLQLKNLRNKKAATVALLNQDGSLNEAAFTEVDRVFGFPTGKTDEHISPRLLFMLSYFADRIAPGKVINIESAYRSPDYNDKIRKKGANAARTSTHMDGLALDFWLAGVNGKELWETIRKEECCGVGHYGGKTIHLDAGRPRFWEAATSGTKDPEPDYNRHLYLSTDYDRYVSGESIRLSLSGISTFDFGVRPTVHLYAANDPENPAATAEIKHTDSSSDCLSITDRKAARSLFLSPPTVLVSGRYRIEVTFCRKPFEQMPSKAVSREIEIVKHSGE